MRGRGPVVFQVIGYKNTGKTTLVCGLVQAFKRSGYRVGTIKHDGHDFDIDHPGTDTWQHRASGADMVAITSARQTAMIESGPVRLEALIGRMGGAEVVIVEGFKDEHYPKIVLLKEPAHAELLERVTSPVAAVCWYEGGGAAGGEVEGVVGKIVEEKVGKTAESMDVEIVEETALKKQIANLPYFGIDDTDGIFRLMLDLVRSGGR